MSVPDDVLDAIAARGEWAHVRPLEGVVAWPVLRPDGSTLSTPGYDKATRLISSNVVNASVSDAPKMVDVQQALALLYEVARDFPFASDACLSAWYALLLTVPARHAISEPVPLGLIDGNARAVGKGLLVDLIGEIDMGFSLARRAVPHDTAEWHKSMLSIAMAAEPVVLFDNVTRTLRSEVLDAVLTGTSFQGRALGTNEEPMLAMRTLFLATSNNATVSTDLVRRSLHVRLETRDEHPEQRSNFRHPDLRAYVRANRAALLSAALTVLRGYIVAGRPAVELVPMGSFEEWSALVRGALVWAGMPDPGRTQDSLREMGDPERDALSELLTAWRAHFGGRFVASAEVLAAIDRDAAVLTLRQAVMTACRTDGKPPDARRLGNILRGLRSQIADGLVLEAGSKGERGMPWRVRDTRLSADSADSADSENRSPAGELFQ